MADKGCPKRHIEDQRQILTIPIGTADGWAWREVLQFILGAFQYAGADEELQIAIVRRKPATPEGS